MALDQEWGVINCQQKILATFEGCRERIPEDEDLMLLMANPQFRMLM